MGVAFLDIVSLSADGIGESLVGLCDFEELVLGGGRLVFVWMVDSDQFGVSSFDLVQRRLLSDVQDFVVVFREKMMDPFDVLHY